MPYQPSRELSEPIHDIINYRPRWVVRQGTLLFFGILIALFLLSFVIRYPDMIEAPARLSATNAPQAVIAKKGARLHRLFKANNDPVTKGQVLGYLESTADYEEVKRLQQWIGRVLTAVQQGNYSVLSGNPLPALPALGPLQTNYQEFQNQYELARQTMGNGYFQQKTGALQKDIQYLAELKSNASRQQQLVMADQQLQQKEFTAYESLAKDKVIAPLELNQVKSRLLAKEQALKQADIQLTNADISTHNKQKEILEIRKQVGDLQQNFNSSLLTLKASVEAWQEENVLTAPESGILLFAGRLQESDLVTAGQALFYIQPPKTEYFVEITASQLGLGKIKAGQRVMLKIESYPSQEFGSLAGVITQVSEIPNSNDSFMVRVALPQGLKTNYGKPIAFKSGLRASASIITDDRKLSDRLLGQLQQIFDRH